MTLTLKKPEPKHERMIQIALERAVKAADLMITVQANYPEELGIYEQLVPEIGPEQAYEAVEFIAGLYRKAGITA